MIIFKSRLYFDIKRPPSNWLSNYWGSLQTKLLALKRDWFLNREDGIAWFDYLTKNPNTKQLEIDVKAEIFKVDGVVHIDSFDILLDSDTQQFLIQISYTDKFNNHNEASFNVTDNR